MDSQSDLKRDIKIGSVFELLSKVVELIDLELLRHHNGRYVFFDEADRDDAELRLEIQLVVDCEEFQQILISIDSTSLPSLKESVGYSVVIRRSSSLE